MTKNLKHTLFHILSFYLVWFACILNASKNQPWIGVLISVFIISVQLIWQVRVARDTRDLARLIIILTVFSILVDTLLMSQNVLTYQANILAPYFPPPWIIVQWVEFAIVIHALLENYWTKPLLLGVLSLVGFALAYLAGERVGAATLNYGYYSAAIIGIVWAIILPLIILNHSKKVSAL